MRVLITNQTLETRTGTETFVRDLALGLLARGHHPVVYSPRLGPLAEELRAATVPVVDDLERVAEAPDLIHGHHLHETMAAFLRFPAVPGLFVVHDWHAWQDHPPRFPRILRYVAVDGTRRDRLVLEQGIPAHQVVVIPNSVDTHRFRPRPPLPDRPGRALVFSSYVRGGAHLQGLRAACRRRGILLEVAGSGVGRLLERPEDHLPRYDLVFALGRSALEAMAVGSAVVVWGLEGLGGMVDRTSFGPFLDRNFGRRALRQADGAALDAALGAYDPAEAAAVQALVRTGLGLEGMTEAYLDLYARILEEAADMAPDPAADLEAARRYLEDCVPRVQVLALLGRKANLSARRIRRLADLAWGLSTLAILLFIWRLLALVPGAQAWVDTGILAAGASLLALACFLRSIASTRAGQWAHAEWMRRFHLA